MSGNISDADLEYHYTKDYWGSGVDYFEPPEEEEEEDVVQGDSDEI